MNPSRMFCPNPECAKRGLVDQGNITIHSRRDQRYRCTTCRRTFAATHGTPFYRLRTDRQLVIVIVTLLAYGCPPQAIVQAFGLDGRTVLDWLQRAGAHCERVQGHLVEAGQVEAEHVQADELWVKMVGRKVWMALALVVSSRLWLGGEISAQRDGDLIRDLALRVRRAVAHPGILLCVDGLSSYVTQFCRVFRESADREPGQRGVCRQVLPAGFLLGQVVKSYVKNRVSAVSQRAVCGTLPAILERIRATGGEKINTAYIERLNATFRSRLSALIRRGRGLLRQDGRLRAGMYLVGTVYNFCTEHDALRELAPAGTAGRKWRERTPAMAAGLTDHVWTVRELLECRVPPRLRNLQRWRGKSRKGALATTGKQPPTRSLRRTTV